MSRFPKLTETFVLNEIVELRRLGFTVDIFPLLQHRETVQHPEVAGLLPQIHNAGPYSKAVMAANLSALWRHPKNWSMALSELIRGNMRSPALLLHALALLPKMVWMASAMARLDIGHIHAHFATHPALAALMPHRLTGIGYSFTGHGSDLHVDQTMLGHKVAASRFCVMISEYNRRFVIAHSPQPIARQLRVVRTGIDPEMLQGHTRAATDPEPLRILMVAALREVKGHEVLLQACRRLSDAGIDFRCELAGDGPLRESLRARIDQLGLARRIHLLGPQTRQQVAALMFAAHILVMPSVLTRDGRREGIPVVLMEAMASELPVLASRLSGIPELVQDRRTGLLFPPGDAAALSTALPDLAEHPARRETLGRQPRAWVLEAYDIRRNTRQLADLFCDQARVHDDENISDAPR